MSAKQNDKQDRSEQRSELSAKDGVSSPETSFALPIEEVDPTNHAVRSPERAKNVFFENDYLNGE